MCCGARSGLSTHRRGLHIAARFDSRRDASCFGKRKPTSGPTFPHRRAETMGKRAGATRGGSSCARWMGAGARNDQSSPARRSGTHLGFSCWSSRRKSSRVFLALVFVRVGVGFRFSAGGYAHLLDGECATEVMCDCDALANVDERVSGRSGATDGSGTIRGTTSRAGPRDVCHLPSRRGRDHSSERRFLRSSRITRRRTAAPRSRVRSGASRGRPRAAHVGGRRASGGVAARNRTCEWAMAARLRAKPN